jgi:hypothetical protein
MASGITTHSDRAGKNREFIDRASLLLESWLLDAFGKHDFHGDVTVCVTFADGKPVLMKPSIEQKVRVAG